MKMMPLLGYVLECLSLTEGGGVFVIDLLLLLLYF